MSERDGTSRTTLCNLQDDFNFDVCDHCGAVKCSDPDSYYDEDDVDAKDVPKRRVDAHDEYLGDWMECGICERVACYDCTFKIRKCWACYKYGDVLTCCNLLRGESVCDVCLEDVEDDARTGRADY